jgi:hypothetical protein
MCGVGTDALEDAADDGSIGVIALVARMTSCILRTDRPVDTHSAAFRPRQKISTGVLGMAAAYTPATRKFMRLTRSPDKPPTL